jgi:hypothetical protein
MLILHQKSLCIGSNHLLKKTHEKQGRIIHLSEVISSYMKVTYLTSTLLLWE